MKYDYLVIGAGISGLSSALLLARFGFKVGILEQAPRPAPLIEGFVRNNVYFDTGFHYAGGLEEGGALDRHLRLLGLDDALEKVPLDAFAYDTVVQPQSGINFSFPQGYEALGRKLRGLFPRHRQALKQYFARLKEATSILPYYSCHSQGQSFPIGLASLHAQSLSQVLDELAINGELRTLLQVHCLLHGSLPCEIPFALHAGVVDGYYGSAQTFKGGGRALATALVKALKRCGVDLFCRHRVEGIQLSAAGAIAGVRCANGARIQALACLSTLHPQALLQIVPDSVFRPVYRRRLAALSESPGAEMVFLSSPHARKFLGRNFFFLPEAGTSILDCGLPLLERLLYLNFSGLGGVCGSGDFVGTRDSGVTAIVPSPYFESGEMVVSSTDYAADKRRTGELVRKRVALLLPELGPGLKVEAVATSKTLKRINASARGSLYGVKQMVGQFNPAAKTRLDGLYLAGQATTAPGLLGAVTSALMAVGAIVGHDRVEALRSEIL